MSPNGELTFWPDDGQPHDEPVRMDLGELPEQVAALSAVLEYAAPMHVESLECVARLLEAMLAAWGTP